MFCASFILGRVPLNLHVGKWGIELNFYCLFLPFINFILSVIWPGIILQFVISSFLYFVLSVSPFVFDFCNILLRLILYDFVASCCSRNWPTDCCLFQQVKNLSLIELLSYYSECKLTQYISVLSIVWTERDSQSVSQSVTIYIYICTCMYLCIMYVCMYVLVCIRGVFSKCAVCVAHTLYMQFLHVLIKNTIYLLRPAVIYVSLWNACAQLRCTCTRGIACAALF